MRHFPDWIIYLIVLGIVLYAVFANGMRNADAPEPLAESLRDEGAMLPELSIFDEQVLVQVDKPEDGSGTAFLINDSGYWMTARHVVDGCETVAILVAPGRYVEVDEVILDEVSDLAMLRTSTSPKPLALNLDEPLRKGETGFHIGYPQGRPGEVASRLWARSRLITRGMREGDEPVIAWAEMGRTRGLGGSLSGMSGGPVLDQSGRVRGVTIAEAPRRGRVYTAGPAAMQAFLDRNSLTATGSAGTPIAVSNYGRKADEARGNLQIVKVACDVAE